MTTDMPRVAVILSTYNGERFLKEQLDSVFAQRDAEVVLFVRDDGSSDSTIEILRSYGDGIQLFPEENQGVGNSFMNCLYKAGEKYDYYAFCDQDDIWSEDKLIQAVNKLSEQEDKPALYCSNQQLVDASGNMLEIRHSKPVDTSYLQILNNNQLTGCTMVWNKALQNLLCDEARRPSPDLLKKRIHDVWVGMVASVTGIVVYDENSFIRYRQHDRNVVGSEGSSAVTEWKNKLKDSSLRNGRSTLAKEILEKFGDRIAEEDRAELGKYAYYRSEKKCRKALLKEDISEYSGESKLSLKAKILLKLV